MTKVDGFESANLLPLETLEVMEEELILVKGGNASGESPSICNDCDCCHKLD